MKRIISAVTAAVMFIPLHNGTLKAETASGSIRIMAVGDSITDGYWEQGGYRKYMSMELTENGLTDIDLVGPKGADEESFEYNGRTVVYDGNYAGYSGYAIQYMTGTETRQGILETLRDGDHIKNYDPDIVLLQIGTNDVLSAYNDGITDRLENLISYILSEGSDGMTVFVSTIPDIDAVEVSDWLWAYGDIKWNSTPEDFTKIIQGHIDDYNASIGQLVTKMQSNGMNVRFADIHSVVDVETDLYDGVHPNEAGYEKMGMYWAGVLKGFLNGQAPTGSTEEPTDTPEYNVADIVSLADHLLGRPQQRITAENSGLYDFNSNSGLDVYDLVLLRRKVFAGRNV